MNEATTTRLYFAYGSNLNIGQMAWRCPTARPVEGLRLHHWRLVFRRVADIEPARGQSVVGGLWSVLPEDEEALDQYEGIAAGLYRKEEFRMRDGRIAFFYVMNRVGLCPPPLDYYNAIREGYGDWGFDTQPLRLAMITAAGSRSDPWQSGENLLLRSGRRLARSAG